MHDKSALQLEGKEAAEALAALEGKPAIYHCVSRIVSRDVVLHRDQKDQFVLLMRLDEAFSHVTVRPHSEEEGNLVESRPKLTRKTKLPAAKRA